MSPTCAPFSFILVIAVVVQFTEMVVRKTSPLLHRVLGVYLPLITTNCAVLGVALLNINQAHNFMQSLFYGLGAALGFSLVLVRFAAMRRRLVVADIPEPFQGRGHRDDYRRAGLARLHGLCGTGVSDRVTCEPPILLALLAVVGMGIVFGGLLGFASVKFEVEGNPLSDQINSDTPANAVWGCGYPGCRPYAEAIADGDSINKCPPGGEDTIQALANLLDVEPEPLDAEHGVEKEPLVAYIREAECIGCTKCIRHVQSMPSSELPKSCIP